MKPDQLETQQVKFSPRWWLRNPHLQTVYASKLAKRPKIHTIRERHELDDGDFLDLNWSHREHGPIVCLFHGLAGCIDSAYARASFAALETAGFRPVFMHHRGCSGVPNRLRISYHSGFTDDIAHVVALVRQRYPDSAIACVGFSLAANALLKHLGETPADNGIDMAIAVCPPLVLSTCANTINSGFARIYQRYLLSLMHQQYETKRITYPNLKLDKLPRGLNTFWRFDDAVTAPLHGFRDVHDYYTSCSARSFVKHIRTWLERRLVEWLNPLHER